MDRVRVDKWLWAARFFKTRTLAQNAVDLGRVKMAGQRIKPSREIEIGTCLQIERGEETFDVFVEAISDTRGSAKIAVTLYRETPESIERRERVKTLNKIAAEPASTIQKGRPTKRDARRLRELKNSWFDEDNGS